MIDATQIILVCHAPLGSALHAVACHGFNRQLRDAIVVDVLSKQSKAEVSAAIESAWQEEGGPRAVLLLTDLHGATPSNGASLWMTTHRHRDKDCEVAGVTGVSLPLLLKALTYKTLSPEALATHLLTNQPDCGCRLEALA